MFKKIKSLVVTGTLVFGVSALAGNRIAEIKAENPAATPFEVLRQLYDESTQPALATDFDLISDQNSNQKCVVAGVTSKTPDTLFMGRGAYKKSGSPGTPSYGPLFPGTPATPVQEGYFIAYTTEASVRADLAAVVTYMVDKTEIMTTSTELIQTFTDSSDPDSPRTAEVRRSSSGLLAIKFRHINRSSSELIRFGYCYRE